MDPHSLPRRPGYTIVHTHEEGKRCTIDSMSPHSCAYQPTKLTRLRQRLGL